VEAEPNETAQPARHFPRIALLAATTVLMLIVAALLWIDLENSRATEGWMEHTYQVLNDSSQVLSSLQEAEGQQRGFLLTGEEQYLESYRATISRQTSASSELRADTRDNPSQQKRLRELDRLAAARMTLFESGIAARKTAGITGAIDVVKNGQGPLLMREIRGLLGEVDDEERRLLVQRTHTAAQQSARTRFVLAGGTALLATLLIFAGITIERDIRKIKASEQRLRTQAHLIDLSHDAIIVADEDRVIQGWNAGATAMYGWSETDARGKVLHELLMTRSTMSPGDVDDVLKREGRWNGELVQARSDGNRVVAESRQVLVHNPTGSSAILEINRDITERRNDHERIQQLNKDLEQRVKDRTAQLEASNKEMEAFAYSVSHDLRAPLRGIDGWSLALLEDCGPQLNGAGRKYLERVRSESQRMGYLIDDLLMLSRLSRVEMSADSVDLSSIAHSIESRLRDADPKRQLEFSIQEGLHAKGDTRLLEIVLFNLLSNAVKFTGTRERASIQFGRTWHSDELAFFVKDNGVGFDMAYAGVLFGAFQRLHKYSEFPGTGIGLAIAQRVLRRHGGRIWAEARPDEGATFFFTIGPDSLWDREVPARID
jgi:PAS domain S-box-containing protein